jgi:hypothetical protein
MASNNKKLIVLAMAFMISAVVALFSWQRSHAARTSLVDDMLEPVAALLKENQSLIRDLQAEPFLEKDNGILESYLIKIRRDGVPKHADMKQRLDQLAENNTAIVTLIKAYAPHANTHTFVRDGDRFRNYASAWRDRWNSVMELYMAGGNYVTSGVPFPTDYPDAVDAEMASAKR